MERLFLIEVVSVDWNCPKFLAFIAGKRSLLFQLFHGHGAQHLADAEAYRNDRRKDALLQENGYFVLRFLAEDVGKRLDMILDSILATLVHRGRKEGRRCAVCSTMKLLDLSPE